MLILIIMAAVTIAIVAVIKWIFSEESSSDLLPLIPLLVVLCASSLLITFDTGITIFRDIPRAINTYERTSIYYRMNKDNHSDVGLAAKKAEMNQWLYEVQFNKNRYGIFSLYPDSVMQLREIE